MHKKAVAGYFQSRFGKLGGTVALQAGEDDIEVQWTPARLAGDKEVFQKALELLKEGAYDDAEPLLMALVARPECDPLVRMNYGMMLSDRARLEEALAQLEKAAEEMQDSADVWNALGVAYQRKGERSKALAALKRSNALDPDNPYTLKNLGSLLGKSDPHAAIEYFKRASELLPKDQQTLYFYGLSLYNAERYGEAVGVLRQAIEIAPHTETADSAMSLSTKIAHKNLKAAAGGKLRPDAVIYCREALRKFEGAPVEVTQAVTFEVAMLGRGGLDINNADKKYTLKSMPGEFSGLELVCYMYVGTRILAPDADPGIDLAHEYETALELHKSSGQ